jgi:hypothetical protein
MAALSTRTMIVRCNGSLQSFANSLPRSQSLKLLIDYAHRNTSLKVLCAMRLARSGCDAVGLAIIPPRGVKVQKGFLMLRSSRFIAILNYAYALCTCLAQPSLLGICLATAWQVKPLITSAAKRCLRVLVESGFTRIHFSVTATQSTRQRMPCRS